MKYTVSLLLILLITCQLTMSQPTVTWQILYDSPALRSSASPPDFPGAKHSYAKAYDPDTNSLCISAGGGYWDAFTSSGAFTDFWCFDLDTNEWTLLAPAATSGMPINSRSIMVYYAGEFHIFSSDFGPDYYRTFDPVTQTYGDPSITNPVPIQADAARILIGDTMWMVGIDYILYDFHFPTLTWNSRTQGDEVDWPAGLNSYSEIVEVGGEYYMVSVTEGKLFKFNPSGNPSYFEAKADMPAAIVMAASLTTPGKIYTYGGDAVAERSILQTYDIATDTWISEDQGARSVTGDLSPGPQRGPESISAPGDIRYLFSAYGESPEDGFDIWYIDAPAPPTGCSDDTDCGIGGYCGSSNPKYCVCASAHDPNPDYSACSPNSGTVCSSLVDTSSSKVQPFMTTSFSQGMVGLTIDIESDTKSRYNIIVKNSDSLSVCYSMDANADSATSLEDLDFSLSVVDDGSTCKDQVDISLDWSDFVACAFEESPGNYKTIIEVQRIAQKDTTSGTFSKRAEATYSTSLSLSIVSESEITVSSDTLTIELAPGITLEYYLKETSYNPSTRHVTVIFETTITDPLKLIGSSPFLDLANQGSWGIAENQLIGDCSGTGSCTQEIQVEFDLTEEIAADVDVDGNGCFETTSDFSLIVEPVCAANDLEPSTCSAPATLDSRTAALSGSVEISICSTSIQNTLTAGSFTVSTGSFENTDDITATLQYTSNANSGFELNLPESGWESLSLSDGTVEYDLLSPLMISDNTPDSDSNDVFTYTVDVDALQTAGIDLTQDLVFTGTFRGVFSVSSSTKRSLPEVVSFATTSSSFSVNPTENLIEDELDSSSSLGFLTLLALIIFA